MCTHVLASGGKGLMPFDPVTTLTCAHSLPFVSAIAGDIVCRRKV